MKKTIALWLATRAETNARRIRRDLRDQTRRELTTAARSDQRARGLRLYAAWQAAKLEIRNEKFEMNPPASGGHADAARPNSTFHIPHFAFATEAR